MQGMQNLAGMAPPMPQVGLTNLNGANSMVSVPAEVLESLIQLANEKKDDKKPEPKPVAPKAKPYKHHFKTDLDGVAADGKPHAHHKSMKWFFRYINDEDGVDVTKTGEHKDKKPATPTEKKAAKKAKKLSKKQKKAAAQKKKEEEEKKREEMAEEAEEDDLGDEDETRRVDRNKLRAEERPDKKDMIAEG